MEDTM